jgi:hypothetical protein
VVNQEFSLELGEPAQESKLIKWQVVTNHRNLFYMLGSGMIMPPAGFGGKYYEDTLSCVPGWIPVFPNNVPKEAILHSVKEKNHLIPCILELDLSHMHGSAKAVFQNDDVRDIEFPGDITGNETMILIPAPLPITCISLVAFPTKEDKVACEKDASDFGNVDLAILSCKTAKGAFKQATNLKWPQQFSSISTRNVPLEKPLAAGAVLAVLAHLGNSGDLAIDAARVAFGSTDLTDNLTRHSLLTPLAGWFQLADSIEDQSNAATLFWRIVNCLIDAQERGDLLSHCDVVLAALEAAKVEMDDASKVGADNLIEELKNVVGLGDFTLTELLERHAKPLPRSLILFFLKGSCEELFEYRHELLGEYDYIVVAILFAVREKWLGLPSSLRKLPGLQEACCHRMAEMSHRLAGNSWQIGDRPLRPKSLRELFREAPWSKAQNEAALVLARKCNWDCIRTRVSLKKGEYRLEVDGSGLHFVLDGEPKAVKTEADYEAILEHLANTQIPARTEFAARALLRD